MRFAIVIILITFAVAVFFAVMQLVFRFAGGGDAGRPFGAGSDGGIYRSSDGGVSFSQSATVSEDVNFVRFDVLDLREDRQSPGTWWAATEGAGVFRSLNQGEAWETVWGEGAVLERAVVRSLAQAQDQSWLFALDAGGRGRIWKTTDNGLTFREVYSAARNGVFVVTIAIPSQDSAIVLAGLSDGLLIGSTDGGESWTSLNQFSASIREIVFAPSDPLAVYLSVDRVGPYRSGDRGVTWKNLNEWPFSELAGDSSKTLPSFAGGRQVFGIAVHPADPNRILFASTSGLLASNDGGKFFRQLPVPLRPEALPLRSVVFDPSAHEIVYVTAGDGFYASFDGGENWRVTRFTISPKLSRVGVSVADRNILLVGTSDAK